MRHVTSGDEPAEDLPEEYRLAAGNPFGIFTVTMTEVTVAASRAFGAELVAYPSDHAAGMLTAAALEVPALEVGNRVSWSMRDVDGRAGHDGFGDSEVTALATAAPEPPRRRCSTASPSSCCPRSPTTRWPRSGSPSAGSACPTTRPPSTPQLTHVNGFRR